MAADYGNLGNLAYTRKDLAAAEGYYAQSLTLNQALGRKEGMATNFGNLGGLEHARGNMARARAFWGKRAIFMQRSECPIGLNRLRGCLMI
ncbi:MAG: hypothetical protein ACO20S_08845 [Paracoccaceae bacterium]